MQRWNATPWIALVGIIGALAGPLVGAWFGKRIERQARREEAEEAEQLESTRTLKKKLLRR
jgi:hypothetical protein